MMSVASIPSARDASPPVACLRRFLWALLLVLLGLGLSGCKIVISVPYGGKVTSEDGFECQSGQVCEIDVSDESFDSTFTAVAAKGYTFTHWRRKPAAFCGAKTTPCYLTTTNFDGNETMAMILASDQEFFLEPVFVQYKRAYWQSVLKQIDAGSFTTDGFLYALKPNVANCDPGTLTPAAKSRALQALNQTRSLHQLPAVSLDSTYDMQAQEASLVQTANNYLNHFPMQGDKCYTAGARQGAETSNLYGGTSAGSDPAADVFGWTNDAFNIANLMAAGHRRWVLFPQLGFTSYGQTLGFSALKVFGFTQASPNTNTGNLEFVAMPYQSYPYILVDKGAKPTPWSFSMVPPSGMSSDFDYFQNATVTVTDNDSGKALPVTNLYKDNQGFGLMNFLSWMVGAWDYDKPYTVKISGIRMPGGNVRDIEYGVMLDRFNLLNLNHPLESGDGAQGNMFQGNFNTAKDKDTYKVGLTGNKTISGQSEFSNQAFFILVYDQNKRLVKSSDSTITGNFGIGKHTIVVSPCDENGICYQGTKTYKVTVN